ncbi:FAD binding domain-containing protein [Paramyrothecium foliicola]|nr:FAD binding domain-containing protein [Paramyrothecium foliicola]
MANAELSTGQNSPDNVIVVGAGPVGLAVAARLSKSGIRVDVVEKRPHLDEASRAAGYFGAALNALARTGVLEKARALGFLAGGICWRKPLLEDVNGEKKLGDVIAKLPFPSVQVEDYPEPISALILPQSKLSQLLYEECISSGLVSVHFNAELVGIEDTGAAVNARVKNGATGAVECLSASFLVGADGGRSATRKLLDIPFKGHSWPEQLLAIDCNLITPPDIEDSPISFIVHPVDFAIILPLEPFEVGKKSKYRVAMAIAQRDTESDEEVHFQELAMKVVNKIVPGPRPLDVELIRIAPYHIHQLCASTFRRGRCMLAGDAAHLNNPFGAMGLTNGLLDADALSDALDLIINKGKPLGILDIYSRERSKVFQFFVNPLTTQNKLRCASDPERATDDWLIDRLINAPSEVAGGFSQQFLDGWRTDMIALTAKH